MRAFRLVVLATVVPVLFGSCTEAVTETEPAPAVGSPAPVALRRLAELSVGDRESPGASRVMVPCREGGELFLHVYAPGTAPGALRLLRLSGGKLSEVWSGKHIRVSSFVPGQFDRQGVLRAVLFAYVDPDGPSDLYLLQRPTRTSYRMVPHEAGAARSIEVGAAAGDVDGDGLDELVVNKNYLVVAGRKPNSEPYYQVKGRLSVSRWRNGRFENVVDDPPVVQHAVSDWVGNRYNTIQVLDLDGDGKDEIICTEQEDFPPGRSCDRVLILGLRGRRLVKLAATPWLWGASFSFDGTARRPTIAAIGSGSLADAMKGVQSQEASFYWTERGRLASRTAPIEPVETRIGTQPTPLVVLSRQHGGLPDLLCSADPPMVFRYDGKKYRRAGPAAVDPPGAWPVYPQATTGPRILTIGDVDGDGRPEFVVGTSPREKPDKVVVFKIVEGK